MDLNERDGFKSSIQYFHFKLLFSCSERCDETEQNECVSQGAVDPFKNHKVKRLSSAEHQGHANFFHHHSGHRLLVLTGRSAADGGKYGCCSGSAFIHCSSHRHTTPWWSYFVMMNTLQRPGSARMPGLWVTDPLWNESAIYWYIQCLEKRSRWDVLTHSSEKKF